MPSPERRTDQELITIILERLSNDKRVNRFRGCDYLGEKTQVELFFKLASLLLKDDILWKALNSKEFNLTSRKKALYAYDVSTQLYIILDDGLVIKDVLSDPEKHPMSMLHLLYDILTLDENEARHVEMVEKQIAWVQETDKVRLNDKEIDALLHRFNQAMLSVYTMVHFGELPSGDFNDCLIGSPGQEDIRQEIKQKAQRLYEKYQKFQLNLQHVLLNPKHGTFNTLAQLSQQFFDSSITLESYLTILGFTTNEEYLMLYRKLHLLSKENPDAEIYRVLLELLDINIRNFYDVEVPTILQFKKAFTLIESEGRKTDYDAREIMAKLKDLKKLADPTTYEFNSTQVIEAQKNTASIYSYNKDVYLEMQDDVVSVTILVPLSKKVAVPVVVSYYFEDNQVNWSLLEPATLDSDAECAMMRLINDLVEYVIEKELYSPKETQLEKLTNKLTGKSWLASNPEKQTQVPPSHKVRRSSKNTSPRQEFKTSAIKTTMVRIEEQLARLNDPALVSSIRKKIKHVSMAGHKYFREIKSGPHAGLYRIWVGRKTRVFFEKVENTYHAVVVVAKSDSTYTKTQF